MRRWSAAPSRGKEQGSASPNRCYEGIAQSCQWSLLRPSQENSRTKASAAVIWIKTALSREREELDRNQCLGCQLTSSFPKVRRQDPGDASDARARSDTYRQSGSRYGGPGDRG